MIVGVGCHPPAPNQPLQSEHLGAYYEVLLDGALCKGAAKLRPRLSFLRLFFCVLPVLLPQAMSL